MIIYYTTHQWLRPHKYLILRILTCSGWILDFAYLLARIILLLYAIKDIWTPHWEEEGMQVHKLANFKWGLKIECLTLLLPRVPAVMYGSDSTRVAKYSTSHFHVWILPYIVGLCEVHALFSPSGSLYALGIISHSHAIIMSSPYL